MGSLVYRIPAIIHESDLTPGLANETVTAFCRACLLAAFPRTAAMFAVRKSHLYRYPDPRIVARGRISQRSRTVRIYGCETGRGDSWRKPGIGKQSTTSFATRSGIAATVSNLSYLRNRQYSEELRTISGYAPFQYVDKELPHLLAMADVVVSRAGATTLFELLALRKPSLLIPLSRRASRGSGVERTIVCQTRLQLYAWRRKN